jgi:hypothetical protein
MFELPNRVWSLMAAIGLSSAVLGISSCDGTRPPPCKNQSLIQENVVSASSSNGSASGLLFLIHDLPIKSGEEVKIVWHVTGRGPLSIRYFNPSGNSRPLTFGPKEHLDSSFNRPGDEWGAGFRFDVRGCWHIRLSRAGTSADAWLAVQ